MRSARPNNSWVLALTTLALTVSTSEGFSCSPERRPYSYYQNTISNSASRVLLLESSSFSSQDVTSNTDSCQDTTAPQQQQQQQQQHRTQQIAPPIASSTGFSLEERTRRLLYASPPWTPAHFEEAQETITGWSHRHSRKAALMVERLIRRVVQEQIKVVNDDDGSESSPSSAIIDMSAMYTSAIRGWSNSGERGAAAQRAEEILEEIQHRHMDGVGGIKPAIEAFNLVLMAYARSGLPDAPQQALRVLEKLYEWNTSGATDIAPDKESYATVLRAFAKTGKPDAASHVKRLLEHLEGLAQEEGYTSVRPDYMCHGAYVSALIDAMDRDYITGEEAATEVEAYVYELLSSPYQDARPDSWIFTMALAAWSKSGSEQMVERAEDLLHVFEDYHEWSGRSEKTRPNTVSYNFVLACYSRSLLPNKGERAHKVLRRMQKLVNSGNNTFARPDVVSYNSVMSAYGKSRQNRAPHIVEDLLREMHQVYEETKDGRLRPNRRSFNTCVNAWAKSHEPGAAARIMDWIVHMQENAEREGRRSLRPDKWSFNGFLTALSKSGEPTMGKEAEAVLDQMIEYYDRGWTELKPCVLTFTNVCHCIAVSGADDALERSLAIIRRMEDLHEQGWEVRPNCYTYNCVINAAAKSKRAGKAQIAVQILRRMQEVALRPPTVTYNNVLNACAFADHPDDHPEDILDIANEVFEEAKQSCGPNYITYSAYLKVICRFVKDGTKKCAVTWDVYRQCCEAGQLTKMVMRHIKYCLTARQYEELRADAIEDEKTGQYHKKYTENARMAKLAPSLKRFNQ